MSSKRIYKEDVKMDLAWWFTYLYMPLLNLFVNVVWLFNKDLHINTKRVAYWVSKARIITCSECGTNKDVEPWCEPDHINDGVCGKCLKKLNELQ